MHGGTLPPLPTCPAAQTTARIGLQACPGGASTAPQAPHAQAEQDQMPRPAVPHLRPVALSLHAESGEGEGGAGPDFEGGGSLCMGAAIRQTRAKVRKTGEQFSQQ